MEAHTNADDATRYRAEEEVAAWARRDPVVRLERLLRADGLLDDAEVEATAKQAEELAGQLRERMSADPVVSPAELFAHVYADMPPRLREQAALLADELADGTADDVRGG
jgi:2-oxoisovalerate dehydrogenase E1 component alpha subunit